MVEWYAIEINPHDIPMCTDVYKCLKDVLHCKGISGSALLSVITDNNISDSITKIYVQIVKDSKGWRYMGLYALYSSLQDQVIVLTTNEFYSRFCHRTVTL